MHSSLGKAEFRTGTLSHRFQLYRRLAGAADDHRLAILHALDQSGEVGLGFVDVHPLCHIRIIG
jgi:hypothetical protein